MKTLDRLLQSWRFRKIKPYIVAGTTVLDVGCADASLYHFFPGIKRYVGIDPTVEPQRTEENFQIILGSFPNDLPDNLVNFDNVIMLAILEHIPESAYQPMARRCFEVLKPGGRLVLTVPEPMVDDILHLLQRLHLIDGLSLEEHHAFDTQQVPRIFKQAGFREYARCKFQLGLNNLFVFERPLTA